MNDLSQVKVGDTCLLAQYIGRGGPILIDVPVVRIGRKYIYVMQYGQEWPVDRVTGRGHRDILWVNREAFDAAQELDKLRSRAIDKMRRVYPHQLTEEACLAIINILSGDKT